MALDIEAEDGNIVLLQVLQLCIFYVEPVLSKIDILQITIIY